MNTLDMFNESPPTVPLFYFVRHGETDWNKEGIYQGLHDIPLNELGFTQAREVAQQCSSLRIDGLLSSPLSRALATAQIISELNHSLPLEIIPEFAECASEQSARFVLKAKGAQTLPSFEKLVGFEESAVQFLNRIHLGLRKMLTQTSFERPLIVAHGGTCTGISHLLGVKQIKTPNCQIIKFELNSRGVWEVESH